MYIYFDILGRGRAEEAGKLAQLLLCARRHIALAHSLNFQHIQLDDFVKQCQELVSSARARAEPRAAEEARANSEAKLLEAIRCARKGEEEINRSNAYPEYVLGLEYDSLLRIKKVKEVRVTDAELIVETQTLFCTEPNSGVTYLIGEFEIHIPLVDDSKLCFLNRTQTVGGMNAPHVNGAGYACLGSTKDLFPELIGKREYAAAVNLAILFLESVNTADVWGSRIVYWPRAS
jgi:hypothetical protein